MLTENLSVPRTLISKSLHKSSLANEISGTEMKFAEEVTAHLHILWASGSECTSYYGRVYFGDLVVAVCGGCGGGAAGWL